MHKYFQWAPPEKTDVRKTWFKHWPKEAQDEVWQRIVKQIESEEQVNTTK